MIQRKQSLYLLAVVLLLVAMLFLPLATITTVGTSQKEQIETAADGTVKTTVETIDSNAVLDVWGVYFNGEKETSLIYMTILVFLAIGVAFANIFLYRKRWLQLRLCLVLGVLVFGIIIFEAMNIYKMYSIAATQEFAAIKYSIADLFPLLALLCVWLAYRGVTRDIALLKSLDRIR